MLDLFAGTGSIGRVFRDRGYEVTSVDWDKRFDPDITVDLHQWAYWEYNVGYFSVIAASPPCTEYSTAMTSRDRDLKLADDLVKLTLKIIQYFKPKHWFIENPQTGHL